MEAWAFVNYTELPPLVALSITTARWGLDSPPGNLIVSEGYLKDISDYNNTLLPAWEFTYGCNTIFEDIQNEVKNHDSSSFYYTPPSKSRVTKNTTISADTKLCTKPRGCDKVTNDTGCVVLIEGIGRTTTGPTHSNIVSLAHGLSALITILSTMGLSRFFGRRDVDDIENNPPRNPNGLNASRILKHFNRPARDQNQNHYPVPVAAPPDEDKAREIAHCADLLREMYKLDLLTWAKEENVGQERAEQDKHKQKADMLFDEIRRIVHKWKAARLGYFTEEEQGYVDEIYTAIQNYDRKGR